MIRRLQQAVEQLASASLSFETLNSEPIELSEEERIRREIVDLRSRVRRSRNGLEERNLNRQIAKLEDELRRIRRAG